MDRMEMHLLTIAFKISAVWESATIPNPHHNNWDAIDQVRTPTTAGSSSTQSKASTRASAVVQKEFPGATSVMNFYRPPQRRFDLKRAASSQPAPSCRYRPSTHLPQVSQECACEVHSVSVLRATTTMSTFGISWCLWPAAD